MLGAEQEDAKNALEDFVEEHTGDEGLLLGAINDKDNVTMGSVKERLKEITPDLVTLLDGEDIDEEREALERCLSLLETKSKTDKAARDAQFSPLIRRCWLATPTLNEAEDQDNRRQRQVVYQHSSSRLKTRCERLAQQLTGRVKRARGALRTAIAATR